MDKDYEKSMLIIDSIVDGISENIKDSDIDILAYVYVKIGNMIDYYEYECKLIEFHFVGYEHEQAYNCVIDQASDIRCLLKGKAICKGFNIIYYKKVIQYTNSR